MTLRWPRSTGLIIFTLPVRSKLSSAHCPQLIIFTVAYLRPFLACTIHHGSLRPAGEGIPIRKSTDRINWKFAGFVFPDGAPSVTDAYTNTTNGSLWAPDVVSR
jgi:hypothetical protein